MIFLDFLCYMLKEKKKKQSFDFLILFLIFAFLCYLSVGCEIGIVFSFPFVWSIFIDLVYVKSPFGRVSRIELFIVDLFKVELPQVELSGSRCWSFGCQFIKLFQTVDRLVKENLKALL